MELRAGEKDGKNQPKNGTYKEEKGTSYTQKAISLNLLLSSSVILFISIKILPLECIVGLRGCLSLGLACGGGGDAGGVGDSDPGALSSSVTRGNAERGEGEGIDREERLAVVSVRGEEVEVDDLDREGLGCRRESLEENEPRRRSPPIGADFSVDDFPSFVRSSLLFDPNKPNVSDFRLSVLSAGDSAAPIALFGGLGLTGDGSSSLSNTLLSISPPPPNPSSIGDSTITLVSFDPSGFSNSFAV